MREREREREREGERERERERERKGEKERVGDIGEMIRLNSLRLRAGYTGVNEVGLRKGQIWNVTLLIRYVYPEKYFFKPFVHSLGKFIVLVII